MPTTATTNSSDQILIRLATGDDAAALNRLAALDSAEVPTGLILMAVVDGTPRVAVEVATGNAVADPFAPTAEIVELVRLRARRLRVEFAAERASRNGRRRVADLIPIRRNEGRRNASAAAA